VGRDQVSPDGSPTAGAAFPHSSSGLAGAISAAWPVGLTALAQGLQHGPALNRRGPDSRNALLSWMGDGNMKRMRSRGWAAPHAKNGVGSAMSKYSGRPW
jgi:hypothetical protein